MLYYRRKFRSQTFDNMDSWKSRGGKSQRGEEKKREDQRGEEVWRKKMQVREKVGKSWFAVFFQWFVAPEGGKVTSLKRARRFGAKHISKSKCTQHTTFRPLLEVEMSKKCTPLWHEAHFQVKSVKSWGDRTTFGSWDVAKSKVSKTGGFEPFLTFRCQKKCTQTSLTNFANLTNLRT